MRDVDICLSAMYGDKLSLLWAGLSYFTEKGGNGMFLLWATIVTAGFCLSGNPLFIVVGLGVFLGYLYRNARIGLNELEIIVSGWIDTNPNITYIEMKEMISNPKEFKYELGKGYDAGRRLRYK